MVHEAPSVKHQPWIRSVYLFTLAVGSLLSAEQTFAFKIVAPADGATLFLNMFLEGKTVAIRGPFSTLGRAG